MILTTRQEIWGRENLANITDNTLRDMAMLEAGRRQEVNLKLGSF